MDRRGIIIRKADIPRAGNPSDRGLATDMQPNRPRNLRLVRAEGSIALKAKDAHRLPGRWSHLPAADRPRWGWKAELGQQPLGWRQSMREADISTLTAHKSSRGSNTGPLDYSGFSVSNLPLNKSRASLAPSLFKIAGPAASGSLARMPNCSMSSISIFISAISFT